MATKKQGGTAKNLTDVNPQYLGVKLYAGETAKVGSVIIRQRGTKFITGANVGLGKDHTIFALREGIVSYTDRRKTGYDGNTTTKKQVHVKAKTEVKAKAEKVSKKKA